VSLRRVAAAQPGRPEQQRIPHGEEEERHAPALLQAQRLALHAVVVVVVVVVGWGS
jgi:hypothetical protein